MNATTTHAVSTFNFHGDALTIVTRDNQPFVAMKPIVEPMGLDWKAQFDKIKSNPRFCVGEITMQMPGDDQSRNVTCLPLRKLSGWLMTIHPNKIKPELREKVIAYQNECDDALWAYWNDGIAVRASYTANPRDILTASQAEQLRVEMKAQCDKLPKGQQGAFMTRGWSRLKSHFGVGYRNIPQFELTEALSMIGRHAAEWEIVEPAVLPAPSKNELTDDLRQNIGALASHMVWVRSWWAAHGPAIKAMNDQTAYTVHDHFIDGVSAAHIVARTIGKELPMDYIKNYPWRGSEEQCRRYRETR